MRSLIVIGMLLVLLSGSSRWNTRRQKTNPEVPPCPNCIKEPPGARQN